jgi:hypothetical protein
VLNPQGLPEQVDCRTLSHTSPRSQGRTNSMSSSVDATFQTRRSQSMSAESRKMHRRSPPVDLVFCQTASLSRNRLTFMSTPRDPAKASSKSSSWIHRITRSKLIIKRLKLTPGCASTRQSLLELTPSTFSTKLSRFPTRLSAFVCHHRLTRRRFALSDVACSQLAFASETSLTSESPLKVLEKATLM